MGRNARTPRLAPLGRLFAHLLCRGFEVAVTCAAIVFAVWAGDSAARS